MEKKKFFINAVILLLIIIGGFVAYRYFFITSDESSDEIGLLPTVGDGENLSAANDEFLILLESLKNVTLDTSLFDNPAYQSLENFSQELEPEPKGRPNPFAPIGVDSQTAVLATTTSPNNGR